MNLEQSTSPQIVELRNTKRRNSKFERNQNKIFDKYRIGVMNTT